jgi:hypothetical protein
VEVELRERRLARQILEVELVVEACGHLLDGVLHAALVEGSGDGRHAPEARLRLVRLGALDRGCFSCDRNAHKRLFTVEQVLCPLVRRPPAG